LAEVHARPTLRNEPGQDDGGIKRDYFTMMMHVFVGCGRYEGTMLAAQLFTHTEDNGYVYRINPKSAVLGTDADQLFELFGWLVARALVDSILLVRIDFSVASRDSRKSSSILPLLALRSKKDDNAGID
jgi:hypothetical protein